MENKSIMRSTYVFAGLFLITAVYFSYYLIAKSSGQMNNSYNKLTSKLAETTVRGSIYDSKGNILAQTKINEEGEEERYYPYGDIFCHVVGVNSYGKSGLEGLYNYQLLSSDLSWVSKVLSDFRGVKYKGNNIITTLDAELQTEAFNAMKGYKGAVIVMEADTGRVLTLMSNPAFDPNTISENWDTLSNDASSPLLNRATMGLYTPGSVFKLFTLEEYLEENENAKDYSFTCKGSVNVDGQSIGCAGGIWHGKLGLMGSFAHSCNGSFINIGSSLNIKKLSELCERLLFNSDLPVSLPYKKSRYSLKEDSSAFLKAQTYFGQGETLVTPIHMALIVSAIANKGTVMEPMFVDRIENGAGVVIKEYDSKEYKNIFTEEETERLKPYLRSVVTEGTASKINHYNNITVYGKTGTAQVDNGKAANSWFAGFAEKDGKAYAIAVVCEQAPNNVSSPATAIAGNILKALDTGIVD